MDRCEHLLDVERELYSNFHAMGIGRDANAGIGQEKTQGGGMRNPVTRQGPDRMAASAILVTGQLVATARE